MIRNVIKRLYHTKIINHFEFVGTLLDHNFLPNYVVATKLVAMESSVAGVTIGTNFVKNVLLNDKIEEVDWYEERNTGDSFFKENISFS